MTKDENKILKYLINSLKIIIYIFLIIIIVINFIIIVKKIKAPEEISDVLGYRSFVIKSGSMEPSIKVGDIVIIKEVSRDDLEVGNIITYISGKSIITHRIVEVKNEDELKFVTKGDFNNTNDNVEPRYEDVLGKVVFSIPKVGSLILFFQNRTVYISFIAVAIFLIYLKKSKNNHEEEYEKIRKLEEANSKEA